MSKKAEASTQVRPRYRASRVIAFALSVLVVSGSVTTFAGSKLYTWKNQAGESVFSDRPPAAGIAYEVVDAVSGSRSAPDASDDQSGTGTTDSGKDKDPVLCEKARMNLIALEGDNTVVVRGDDGESKELSPSEREIAKQTAKAQIEVFCE